MSCHVRYPLLRSPFRLIVSFSWQLLHFFRSLPTRWFTLGLPSDFYVFCFNYTVFFLPASSFKESLSPRHPTLSVKNNRKENTTGMFPFLLIYNLISATQWMPTFPSLPSSLLWKVAPGDRTECLSPWSRDAVTGSVSVCSWQVE